MGEEERPLILIVEDEESIRQILCSALEDEYRILQAEHGRAALALIDAHPEITMVLTDVVMPLVDGIELLRAIRDRSLLLPVVVMTAYDKHQHVLAALRAGAYDFLSKPVELNMIEAAVRRAVAHHEYLMLLQNQRELRAAMAVAQRAAHEINNPLTIIKSIVEYHLAHSSLPDELSDDLQSINEAVNSLSRQVGLLTRIRKVAVEQHAGVSFLNLDHALSSAGKVHRS